MPREEAWRRLAGGGHEEAEAGGAPSTLLALQ